MAESELGISTSQCRSRRIPDKKIVEWEVAACQNHRNKHHHKRHPRETQTALPRPPGRSNIPRDPAFGRGGYRQATQILSPK
jgi:hypothetical protein